MGDFILQIPTLSLTQEGLLHENHCTTCFGQARELRQNCSACSVETQKMRFLLQNLSVKLLPLEMECCSGKCLRVGLMGFVSPLKMTFKTGRIHVFLRWGGDPQFSSDF